MAKISRIEPRKPIPGLRKKVAAYARVSKDSERLLHSVSAQISHYSGIIQKNPDWEYAGVYADEGITGTCVERRDEFRRMIEDCEAGRIDLILTKSVSRFARNTVDLLETVRHLKNIGVEVRFEEQNISTMSGDGEVMLTILASFAQEESVSMSQNIKWAKRKQAEKGMMTNTAVPYGYRYDNGMPVIVPEEAAVVRMIFDDFTDQDMTVYEITNKLNDMGIPSSRGCKWGQCVVRRMLKNVTYTGNMLLGKFYSPDPLTHRHVPNRGEAPMYFVEDSHEAIIDQEIFDKAQEKFKYWSEMGPKGLRKGAEFNCFSGTIVCLGCGKNYNRFTNRMRGAERVPGWSCKKPGGKCMTPPLLERELRKISAEILGTREFDADVFTEKIDHIEVDLDDMIYFHFRDGETRSYQFVRRKASPLKKQRGIE